MAQVAQADRQIRVPGDIAEMLAWLSRLSPDNESIADIAGPILRSPVERRFSKIRDRVETIKAAEKGHDIGGEG